MSFDPAKSPPLVPLAILLASLAVLGAALVSQFGFGYQPCQLCLWQRWPYVATILLGFAGALLAGRPQVRRATVALAGLAFLTGAGIAAFHAGVEYGWWQGLPGCAGAGIGDRVSVGELQAALKGETRVVPCDEPAFTVLGLSMAGWNFVASLLLAGGTAWALVTRKA